MLQPGDQAPQLLKEYFGKYLVVYFYPRDDTPACTTEACGFRDYNTEITKLGAQIIGVSRDSSKSHQKFQAKHNLDFTLLSDPESELQKSFGVWLEKSMFGKKYMGTQRATFIIAPSGKILYVWPQVKSADHAAEVYAKLQELVSQQ